MPVFIIIHTLMLVVTIVFAGWCFYLSEQSAGWGALVHFILMIIALMMAGIQLVIWLLKRRGFKFAKPLMLCELVILGLFLTYVGIDPSELEQYRWFFLMIAGLSFVLAFGVWRGQL